MKRGRFSEEQIVGILKEHEAARKTFLGCEERKIHLVHIQPGRPMQNGHVESVNGRL